MRFLAALTLLVALVCHEAHAETNLVWSPTSTDRNAGTWQCANDTRRVLTGSSWGSSTITTFGAVASTANVFICTADRPIGAGEGCPSPGNYSQERFAPKSQARLCTPPPPTCPPPQPAQESRTMQCTAPQIGQWTQTRDYTCSAPNWIAGPWLPASPPAGVCADPPPPPVINAPHRVTDIDMHSTGLGCRVSANIVSESFPQWIEVQKLGATDIVRSGNGETMVFCEQLGIVTPGEVVMVRIRAANNGGASPWSGYWPIMRWRATPAEQPAWDYYEKVHYEIVKAWDEDYQLTAPPPAP